MQIPSTLVYLLALFVPVVALGVWKARRDYRARGKLTIVGLIALCAMLLVPNLVLDASMTYEMPSTPLDVVGVVIGTLGMMVSIAGMITFRSTKKVFCFDAGELAVSGLYRWSRNPQYVGWGMFLLGFALNDWSIGCLVGMILYLIVMHLIVLVEEEHLTRVFGAAYRAFCDKTPRYLGWGFVRI